MNLALGTIILAWLLIGCALMVIDIVGECRFQTAAVEREELLDAMWTDE